MKQQVPFFGSILAQIWRFPLGWSFVITRTLRKVANGKQGGTEFRLVPIIGTVSPRSFGYLPANSTIHGNEKSHRKSITRFEAKWIRKTDPAFHQTQVLARGRPRIVENIFIKNDVNAAVFDMNHSHVYLACDFAGRVEH